MDSGQTTFTVRSSSQSQAHRDVPPCCAALAESPFEDHSGEEKHQQKFNSDVPAATQYLCTDPSPLGCAAWQDIGNRSRETSLQRRELQLSFESTGQDVYFKTCYQPTTLFCNSLVFSVLIQQWGNEPMPSWPNPQKMCWCLRALLKGDILQCWVERSAGRTVGSVTSEEQLRGH